ncbi:MAG: CinA family nicotinamide mononucleotide deamidase-related protein, partial [Planctomycetota bacterium]
THLGFDVHRLLAVGDAAALLRDEVVRATQDSALVVITGGLGPTADDRARGAIAEAAGCELVEDADSRRHVVERLRSFGREATEGHLRQARFPAGATVFPNLVGTARGFACTVGCARVVAMPGVPREMRPMFTQSVAPFLSEALAPSGHVRTETVGIFPASESDVDERIPDLMEHGRNPSVGITVRDGIVSVSLRARADAEAEAAGLVQRDVAVLQERFGDRIFGHSTTLAQAVADQLERRGVTLGVAESLTGGLVGHMLVDVPGISRFFLADIVAYSDEVKVKQLGVPREAIERHGAVSAQVAEAMARGACAASGSDLGVSTTGIAGPSGGSKEKPVGLVYVGLWLDGASQVTKLNLRGDRWQVKDRSAKHALDLVRLALLRGVESLPPERIL